MFETQQQLLGFATIAIMLLRLVSVALFRMGFPKRPGWLPGFLLLSTMMFIAGVTIWTLYYDHSASLLQGVTLVAMAVCVAVETKSTRSHSTAI